MSTKPASKIGDGDRLGFRDRVKMAGSQKWGYIRIITGTILGGVLGFYVMHRLEVDYKAKMDERLREYELEKARRERMQQLSEFEESV